MKTARQLFVGLAAAAVCSMASAAALPFAGALSNTDPTFNRPLSGNPPTGLSGVGTNVSYDLYPFYVTQNGSYTLQTLSASFSPGTPDDTFLVLYQTAFNAVAPLTNALQADDDAGPGFLSLINRPLTANTQYYMVMTSFSNGAFGNYTGNIDTAGNASAVFGLLNDVPEPSTFALLPLALAGLALTRRRRAA